MSSSCFLGLENTILLGHTQWKNNKRTFHYNAKQPVEMDNEKGWYFPNQENRKKT
jgi:hypothetical protein